MLDEGTDYYAGYAAAQRLNMAFKRLKRRRKKNAQESIANETAKEEARQSLLTVEVKEKSLLAERKEIAMEEEKLLMKQFLMKRTVHSRGLLTYQDPYLPPEVWSLAAQYLPAKDQISIRSLCKSVRAALPKVLLLNLEHFTESIKVILKNWLYDDPVPIKFRLNPQTVEREPFAVLTFLVGYIKSVSLKDVPTFEYVPLWFEIITKFMGDCLEGVILKVLQQPHHPMFSLLTLPVAAYANFVPAMNFLLLPANNSKILKDDYQLSIFFACFSPEALKILLDLQDNRANPAHWDNQIFCLAVDEGNIRIVQLLLQEQRVDPSENGNYPIRTAADRGMLEIFLLLLHDHRVDPSDEDNSAINDAVRNGHLEICAALLKDPRVSPNTWDNQCIRNASAKGYTAIVRLLLADPRVDASANDNEALQMARKGGHLEVVALLEDHLRVETRKGSI